MFFLNILPLCMVPWVASILGDTAKDSLLNEYCTFAVLGLIEPDQARTYLQPHYSNGVFGSVLKIKFVDQL